MRPALGRLALRIYLVSLSQLFAIVASVLVVGWLSIRADRSPDFTKRGRYVLDTLAQHLASPDELQRELDRARAQLRVTVSLYAADGTLIATNVQPPLKASNSKPTPPFFGPFAPDERPPSPRLPLTTATHPGAYAVLRPPPPPSPRDPGLWALGIALIATAAGSVLLARSFARPLSQLSAAARRFGAGDLSARSGLARRDEFGELSRSFDEMAEQVTQLVRSRQELLANVSHELRTPLARIRVALDLAADGDAEMAREALAEIAEDWGELERLVQDVLQSAKLDLAADRTRVAETPLRIEPIATSSLLERAAERFRAQQPDRTLALSLDESLPQLWGDFVLLRRVLDNLLDNAQKYSAAHSLVSLRARRVGDRLEISVEDRGIGINAEDLPHVATPFFRVDRSRTRRTGGLGLGLSLARKIVEAHGGTLEIESAAGTGTTVRVVLPTRPRTDAGLSELRG